MNDGPLRQFVGYGMKRAFAAVQSDVNATLAPFGLRMLTFSALAAIGGTMRLRQSDLAESLAIERPNLVVILDELERADLIIRERARDDRRAYELALTLRGRRLMAKATAAVMEHDNRMTQGLSDDERTVMLRALARIEANGRDRHDAGSVSQT